MNFAGNRGHDLALQRENIPQIAVVGARPDWRLIGSPHQSCRNAHPAGVSPNAALEHISDTQLAPNLIDWFGMEFVMHGRGAGDHTQSGRTEAAELSNHFF